MCGALAGILFTAPRTPLGRTPVWRRGTGPEASERFLGERNTVAKNVWLLVERGRASQDFLDDLRLAPTREKLAEASLSQDSRRPMSRSEPHSLVMTSTGEPFYPHDAQGLDAVLSIGSGIGASFSEGVGGTARFVSAPRKTSKSLWSDPTQYACSCTSDAERYKARLQSATRASKREAMPTVRLPGRMRSKSIRVWKYLFAACAALALLFLARALSQSLATSIRGSGVKKTGDGATDKAVRAETAKWPPVLRPLEGNTGQVGTSALSPEPLNAFAAVVDAKMERDPKAYAAALLRLDGVRNAFAPQTLPSRAFMAAMAMYTTSDDVLDAKPTWRAFLERLGPERQQGIGVVGYEASRIRKDLDRFVTRAQQKGARHAKANGLWALWGVEDSRQALPTKDIRQAAHAALDGLARMERVFPSVAENERVFRNLLTAEAISATLQITWLAETNTLAEQKALGEKLEALRAFVEAVPRPERDTLAFLLEERRAALGSKASSWKEKAVARVDFLVKAQEDSNALCDVRENALLPDFLLQTLRMIRVSGVSPKPVAPWQRCFLSPRAFHAAEKATFDGVPETAVLAYVPRTGPSALHLNAHARVFRADPMARLPARGVGPEAGWHVVAFLSRLVPTKAPFSPEALTDACKKKRVDKALCTQLVFALAPDAETRMEALEREQEDATTDELAHLAFRVALDVYTKRNTVAGGRRPDEGTFKKLGFGRYFGQGYPEYGALEWYIKNAD